MPLPTSPKFGHYFGTSNNKASNGNPRSISLRVRSKKLIARGVETFSLPGRLWACEDSQSLISRHLRKRDRLSSSPSARFDPPRPSLCVRQPWSHFYRIARCHVNAYTFQKEGCEVAEMESRDEELGPVSLYRPFASRLRLLKANGVKIHKSSSRISAWLILAFTPFVRRWLNVPYPFINRSPTLRGSFASLAF